MTESIEKSLYEIYDSDVLSEFHDDIVNKKLILYGQYENKSEHFVTYTKIRKYNDKRTSLNTFCEDIETISKDINEHKFDKDNKILELTDPRKQYFKVFFDLEGDFNEDILLEFIKDFKEFVLKEYHMKCNEFYTRNIKSVHNSASYHVYFNIYTLLQLMPFVINNFQIYTNRKYFKIIDRCVYRYGRLFRCPYVLRPIQRNLIIGDGRDAEDKNDYHDIIKGTCEDCLISNITNCYKIIPSLIILVSPTFSYYNHSVSIEIENEEDKDKVEKQIQSLKEIRDILNKFTLLIN